MYKDLIYKIVEAVTEDGMLDRFEIDQYRKTTEKNIEYYKEHDPKLLGILNTPMPFGKYKGDYLAVIYILDKDYVKWLANKCSNRIKFDADYLLRSNFQEEVVYIKELIEVLQKYPDDMRVILKGYETGYTDVTGIIKKEIALNAHFYGNHDDINCCNIKYFNNPKKECAVLIV